MMQSSQHDDTGKPLLMIFPFGYLSHYLRCLQLAKHLEKHFTIQFLYDPELNHFVEEAGFKSFHCRTHNKLTVLRCMQTFDFSWLNESDLSIIYCEQVQVINRYRPAVVLGDAMPCLKMAAEKTGVYYVSLLNGYMSRYYQACRPLPTAHPMSALLSALPHGIQNRMVRAGESQAFRSIHRPFSKIRAARGLKVIDDYQQELEGDHTIICDLQELFPQKPLPPSYTLVGPLIWNDNINEKSFLQPDTRKPTIFVSMGSTGQWQQVSCLNHPLMRAYNIVAAGDHDHVLSASHVTHVPFAGLSTIVEYADLLICHGGNGTIYQGLAAGVPVLCFPAHFEQEWNAAAVESKGLGKNMTGKKTIQQVLPEIEARITGRNINELRQFSEYVSKSLTELGERLEEISQGILRNIDQKEAVLMHN